MLLNDRTDNGESPNLDTLGTAERPEQEAELLQGSPNQARSGPRARRLAAAMIAWSKDVHRPFLVSLNGFQEALVALRQLHEFVGPALAEREDTSLAGDIQKALRGTSETQRKLVAEFIGDAGPGLVTGETFFVAKEEEDGQGGAGSKDRTKEAEENSENESSPMESWNRLEEAFGNDIDIAIDVLSLAYRSVIGPNRARLLRGSLLISAISALETLVGDLVRQYFLLNPGAMSDEPRFSLKQLQGFESIDQARFEAATIRAEGVAGGDLSDWTDWLKNFPKIKLETHCSDYKALFEAFQRRHVQVHNDGRVSRRYYEKVASVVGESPPVGTYLEIGDEYLNAALDEVETVGNLLAASVWSKVLPDQMPVIVHQLYLRSYDLMLERRWPAVRSLCGFAKIGNADADLLTICRVNELLAMKELGEPIDEVLADWDVSALGPRFQFAHVCLGGDFAELETEITTLIESGVMAWDEILEWPLLAGFREDTRFPRLAATLGKPTTAEESDPVASANADPEVGP